jgi:RNA polymerase sigma-70 factor, ECF subfamily
LFHHRSGVVDNTGIAAERACIEHARRGDPRALRTLHDRYAPRVFAIARRIAGDDALAEDWAQDTWVRIFRALPQFRGDARFSTWIHRIAVNCALHGRRWQDRRTAGDVDLDDSHAACSRSDGGACRIDIDRALDRLPPRMREVLVLHAIEGLSHEEIAHALDISVGTSKSQLFRARAKLRAILEPAGLASA